MEMIKTKTLLLDQTKGRRPKGGEPNNLKESVAKPTEEVTMDAEENHTNDDVVNDANQPQDDSIPNTDNGPLTFDELMATPIDFSKFVMNRLKLDKITKTNFVGPVYKLLKGTYQSSIELEYNMEECYKALSDRLDWTNPEGDRFLYDLSKPLPLKGRLGHLIVPAEHFFNNDLEYLKSKNMENKYTLSITKTKVARYKLVGIEDMILNQWSIVKVDYNKDVECGISHWRPKRQLFYRSQINRLSKHDVYSKLKILSVHKLFYLDGDAIVDLAVALGYNKDMPRRKWSDSDKRRSDVMV
ncbi:hypothetical protein Tco_0900630 [Tanacetum coccineum]